MAKDSAETCNDIFDGIHELVKAGDWVALYDILCSAQGAMNDVKVTAKEPIHIPLTTLEQQTAADGQKIEAIKSIRHRVGCSLITAKDSVEHWLCVGRVNEHCDELDEAIDDVRNAFRRISVTRVALTDAMEELQTGNEDYCTAGTAVRIADKWLRGLKAVEEDYVS